MSVEIKSSENPVTCHIVIVLYVVRCTLYCFVFVLVHKRKLRMKEKSTERAGQSVYINLMIHYRDERESRKYVYKI